MRMYVANPTRQNQVVCYRLDINRDGELKDMSRTFQPARQQDIPPGRQVQLGSDFHIKQIEDIVDQLTVYGMIGVVDLPRIPKPDLANLRGGVVPYIFNLDSPVPASAIRQVLAHNEAVLIEDGRDRRKKAAVASSDIVQHTVANQFAESGIDAAPSDKLAVSYEQEEQSERGERRIEEGYKVSAEAPIPPRRGPGRPRKAA